MADRHEKQRLAYTFLAERARSGMDFAVQDLMEAARWSESTVNTYATKHFRDYFRPSAGSGTGKARRLAVLPNFSAITLHDFFNLQTQTREVYSRYQRVRYETVVTFEFLLPLTRGEELRDALDALFYSDTVTARLRELGLSQVERIVDRESGISDDEYVACVCNFVSLYFAGYSISHVDGRFRGPELLSRAQVGARFAEGHRYLLDEGTAVVRFVIPCRTTRLEYGGDLKSVSEAIQQPTDELVANERDAEVRRIRWLFSTCSLKRL